MIHVYGAFDVVNGSSGKVKENLCRNVVYVDL
ncbi:hypothetical protein F383_29719 [Gossypium arboreum]|uniref:Uncharacterized protein n=1 Tax=Gossypium arboreum TaxID=29729 RepID=A0A0B0PDU0_GOSAR|nr:hypothetical protein F383_29719 [Gossypium arboreum]